jgi:hypothetical protein
MPDSTSTGGPTRLISALERRERAAHRGDSDMIFYFFCCDRPCLSLYDLYNVVNADGEGWARRPPWRKTISLRPRWHYWVRHATTSDLPLLVVKQNLISIFFIAFRRFPPSRHGPTHFIGTGRFFQLWRQALLHIALF